MPLGFGNDLEEDVGGGNGAWFGSLDLSSLKKASSNECQPSSRHPKIDPM